MDFSWHRRAQDCIAQGNLTNSKRPTALVEGVYPTHVTRGQGAYLFDTDGKQYLDFICGLGTTLVGYSNERVNAAIAQQMRSGASHSLASVTEVLAAEKVKELFPFIDLVKFLKTGSEACSAAVRIARAYHGVEYGNETLHEMWHREILDRVSQIHGQAVQSTDGVQGMCETLSEPTACNGNQTIGATALYKDGSRARETTGVLADKKHADKNDGARQGLLPCSARSEAWAARQKAVRGMWAREIASPSLGLLSAVTRDVALSATPRRCPRWLILSDGYHGQSDTFISLTAPGCGVPTDIGILPLKGNEDLLPVAAAVIVEPVITDWSPFRRSYLQDLRDACTKTGTLLIFDEVITGFRWPKRSVSHDWGIYPDLICLGKAIANGMPLAVVGGKKHIMNGAEYFVSSSYAGETLSLAAAIATMEVIQKYDFATYWANGTAFLNEFNAIAPDVVTIEGYPSRGVLKGEALPKALFMQEACEAGLLFGPSYFFSFPMSEQWKNLLAPLRMILGRIQRREVTLRGKLPQSPFAQRVREMSQSR